MEILDLYIHFLQHTNHETSCPAHFAGMFSLPERIERAVVRCGRGGRM